jgi:hypothetical protein
VGLALDIGNSRARGILMEASGDDLIDPGLI